ncbi:MAG: DNA polymerase ligase N-terminal domain-containing protein [Methanotrichaceae archaeon]
MAKTTAKTNPKDSLKPYIEKRDFSITPEPLPGSMQNVEGTFIVQKHDASKLHYDFRLEVGGVLKSWAIPKGPSKNPSDKRLAVETEDHPLRYADFEGIIPKGQYGAGAVIIWDKGTYRNMTQKDGKTISIADALKNGHIVLRLFGKKLTGGYAFTRTKMGWLLVKMRDEEANSSEDVLKIEPRSVISGLSIEDLWAQAKDQNPSPE